MKDTYCYVELLRRCICALVEEQKSMATSMHLHDISLKSSGLGRCLHRASHGKVIFEYHKLFIPCVCSWHLLP